MKNTKKPGIYVLIYLLLVLLFLIFSVPGGLILSMENILPFKYEPYKMQIGISCIIISLIFLAISVKFLLWGMGRMAENLDILFAGLDLDAENHAADGRHYFGKSGSGKNIDIYCKPVKNRRYFGDVKTIKYIGHALDIYLRGDFQTRSSIGTVREGKDRHEKIRDYMYKYFSEKFIAKYGGQIIKSEDPLYVDLEIYGLDKDWTMAFLKNPDIREAITHLLGENRGCIRQHLHVKPDTLHFTTLINIRLIKSAQVLRIVEDIQKIAAGAETLPAPAANIS